MTKKLFCQLNRGYLPLQYFGDVTDKEICKINQYIKKKNSFSAHNAFLE
jgi:uncharacterized protein YfkK (UPF0435 family)